MTRALALACAAVSLLGACYSSDAADADALVTIEGPTQQTLAADGNTVLDLALVVARHTSATTSVSVSVSSGAVSLSADPSSADARTVQLKNLGTGRLPFKLRVGTVPGDLVVSANVGGFLATKVLKLVESPVASIDLEANKHALPADGESGVDITARLFADDAAHDVSLGARIRFDVCCLDKSGAAQSCDQSDPLIVPQIAQLSSGQAIQVRGVTDRIVMGAAQPATTSIMVVAQAVKLADVVTPCKVTKTTATLPLVLRAVAP